MANKPQWKQLWEHQSSDSPVEGSTVAEKSQMVEPMPLFSRLPGPNTAVPPNSRRLPPLHPGVSASTETLQPSSRRKSSSNALIDPSPARLPRQPDGPVNHKRRRLQESDADDRPTSHAYSSQLPQGGRGDQTQSSHGQRSLPSPLAYDTSIGDGGHAPKAPDGVDKFEPTSGRQFDGPGRITRSLTPCCPQRCNGDKCSNLKALLVDVVSEFQDLDIRLQGAIAGGPVDPYPSPPDVEELGLYTPLLWLLEGLRRNNAGIRSLVAPKSQADIRRDAWRSAALPPPSANSETKVGLEDFDHQVGTPDEMKRRRAQEDKEGQVPRRLAPALPPPLTPDGTGPLTDQSTNLSRSLPSVTPLGEQSTLPSHSPQSAMNPSSATSYHQQHPTLRDSHQPAGHQYRTLPSPSSLSYPSPHHSHTGPHPPSLAGPSSYELANTPTPAHLQHLQDLQHQVSVKTLALQTLQSEYDALLAKLERQRTKCTTLEKKFEVSDVEINSLTDERERLQSQITILEAHTEELTKGRDDARKEMAESGRQYIRIVEMASKLQAQGAEDRRKWDEERQELIERIRTLDLGASGDNFGRGRDVSASADTPRMLSKVSTDISMPSTLSNMQPITPVSSGETTSASVDPQVDPFSLLGPSISGQIPSSHPQTMSASTEREVSDLTPDLREEARKLRSRTEVLEATIRNLMEQNRIMQESLQAVNLTGQRMQAVLAKALNSD